MFRTASFCAWQWLVCVALSLGIFGRITALFPQTAQDLARVILQVIEASFNANDALEEPIDLLTRRQIQGPQRHVDLRIGRFRRLVLPRQSLLEEFTLHRCKGIRSHDIGEALRQGFKLL